MAKNYIQEGEVLTMAAPTGGILSGAGSMYGALFGVAQFTAAQGAPVEVSVEGVWLLPKPNSVVAFTVGERIFWDDTAKLCKKTATGFFAIGVATAAADASDSQVAVRLDGTSVTAVP
jgi:predicted RecA/RadA family phage recombinase